MRRSLLTFIMMTVFGIFLIGQDIVQVSIGANYANQVYYTLNNDETKSIGNNTWDLAFAITNSFEAGIHVNESVTISFAGASPTTEIYEAYTNNFDDVITVAEIGDSLYNDETSWGTGGALNILRDPDDGGDFGWGTYNPENHFIEGDRIFFIKLRDNSYRKFIVESLIGGVYTLKYANLDGTGENTVTIDKAAYPNHHLILFSFIDGAVLPDLPTTWDLVFERYSDLDPSNVGVFVEYNVTGILTAPGVLSTEVNGVENPETVNFEDYLDSLSIQTDIIGQDWKFFSLTTGWNIIEDRVFFVKTTDNHLWRLYMYDFEGSSTGTYTFAKWDHGEVAGVDAINSDFASCTIVPNPVNSNTPFSLVIESSSAKKATISLINPYGQLIRSFTKEITSGLNAISVPTEQLQAGNYFVTVQTEDEQIVRKIAIQ